MKPVLISNIKIRLGYKDMRSVKSWCSKFDVAIEGNGKNAFVIEQCFNKSYELALKAKLKSEYRGIWMTVYEFGSFPNLKNVKSVPLLYSNVIERYINQIIQKTIN